MAFSNMRKNKKPAYFITGAAGFIGSTLAERLLNETDAIVIGVDNFHDYYPKFLKLRNLEKLALSPRFQFFDASFENKQVWEHVSRTFDIQAVIHFAAFAGVRPSLEDPHGYYRNNVTNTLSLLDNMRTAGVKDILFTSSSSVYGGNKELPFSERHSTDRPISPYAATKKAGEELLHTYCHLYGLRGMAFRLFTVYGPRQRPDLAIRKFLLSVHRGQPITLFGNGSSKRDYTYVSDVVDAYMAGLRKIREMDSGRVEVFNIGSGRSISLLQMVNTIERSLQKDAVIEFSDRHPADLEVTLADISKARELLGYQPKVDFFDGVCALRDWLLSDTLFQRDLRAKSASPVGDWLLVQRQRLGLRWNRASRISATSAIEQR